MSQNISKRLNYIQALIYHGEGVSKRLKISKRLSQNKIIRVGVRARFVFMVRVRVSLKTFQNNSKFSKSLHYISTIIRILLGLGLGLGLWLGLWLG